MTIQEQAPLLIPRFDHPQDISDDELEAPTRSRKRRIDEISQESLSPAPKRRKRKCENVLKRLETPRIMTRDDAFQFGLRHTSTKVHKLLEKLTKEEREELGLTKRDMEEPEPTRTEKSLTDEELEYVELIAKNYSHTLSSQLLELLAICKKGPVECVEPITSFADALIKTLPKAGSAMADEGVSDIPEEFMTQAKLHFEKISNAMGIIFPEEAAIGYAAKLYEVSQKSEAELDGIEMDEEDRSEKEGEISRTLGNLLFLADQDLSLAASCLEFDDIDECCEALYSASHEQMEGAKQVIAEHEQLLRDTSVHNIDQALNHFTSIQLAKHLLLSNGSFNIGFIDDAIDAIIPEALETTEAVRTSYYLLGNLASTPLGAMKIYEVKTPKNKNLPSNDLVKITLGIDRNTPITTRDVQITILSGLIENVRQAKVGSCFATSWLITLLHKHIDMVVEDYADCIEQGKITRRIDCEVKTIPFQLRTSREGLDISLTIDRKGYLVKKDCYDMNPDEMSREPQPTGRAFIWEVPGIASACQALGYSDVKEVVSRALHEIGSLTFTPKELLSVIARYAYEEDKRTIRFTKTVKKNSKEELIDIAQYAFGIQSRHALHSAWEQMAAASVSYMASQFAMSLWVYDSFKDSISPKPPSSCDQRTFHQYKNKLTDAILLPMISRMRYRYNHYIEEDKRFFDGNRGVYNIGFYGYELCDTGLPKDFEYSDSIAKNIKNQSSYIYFNQFQKYPPEHEWKKVGKDSFQKFICDVISQTVRHLQSEEKGPDKKQAIELWEKVGEEFCRHVNSGTFLEKVTTNLFGPHCRNEQRREFKVNEFTCQSTPWLLRWGGSPVEVIKSLYGYRKDLTGTHKYTGAAPSVLAWRINYCRRQPKEIKEQFSDPFYTTVVINPPHAYVFRPGLERFQEAINSNMPASAWIDRNIVKPGKVIADKRINIRRRKELVDFVASNRWVRPSYQKEDLARQELSDFSKEKFDELLTDRSELESCSPQELCRVLCRAVALARAADPNIGKRNPIWEGKLATSLNRKMQSILGEESSLTKESVLDIIDFARNRRDVIELSPGEQEKLMRAMDQTPFGLSIKEFRTTLIDQATEIRKEELGLPKVDKHWIEKLGEHVDNKILELLCDEDREALISSGLVTDDTNWCEGVHAIFFIWMVNPGTGKLELCRYNKDLQKVQFLHQEIWFPRKKGYYWHLPKNFVTYREEPAFNVKKYTGI